MSREEAILILQELWRYEKVKYKDCEVRAALDMAIKALEQEAKTDWTPVSERLPKEDGDYILWGKVTEDDEEEYLFIGGYDSCREKFGDWLNSEFYEYNRVIAWMPSPKPYKAESEG